MLGIKRLYVYLLQSFIPVFVMTFGICLFIVLMQFVWKYVEMLVGKGVDALVLAELFWYATLTLIPLALPLAVLLASLMTFGNLGEKLELLSIKAAGVSLFKTMRPLIVFILLLTVGMFFFQNNAMPVIQSKFRALFYSIKAKSPELDIPEGVFYSEIEGYNLFVKHKNEQTKTLHGVMIYSISGGLDNMAIIVCDSAKMRMSAGKDYLKLSLFQGQQFSNFKQGARMGMASGFGGGAGNVPPPYARENFKTKDIIIPFDAKFNRLDEAAMGESQTTKNIAQLSAGIDSLQQLVDSVYASEKSNVLANFNVFRQQHTGAMYPPASNSTQATDIPSPMRKARPISIDTVIMNLPYHQSEMVLASAISQVDAIRYSGIMYDLRDTQTKIRYFTVEWYQKFTLSLACLIFFFIGAPLGAIIRKGGLGMPVVISVVLFIVYYVINNIGFKLARDGVWEVWQGMFLSSFVLAPLGIFLTYKAMNDSALMNADAYVHFFKTNRFLRKVWETMQRIRTIKLPRTKKGKV